MCRTDCLNHIYHPETGKMMYCQLLKSPDTKAMWTKILANKLGRLAKGVRSQIPSGTKTICYICFEDMPKDCHATYGKIVCDYKHFKFEKYCACLVVGGNKVDYPYEVTTPTVDITTFKCLVNSVLSTQNVKFVS